MLTHRVLFTLLFATLVACANQSRDVRPAKGTPVGPCKAAPSVPADLNPTNYRPRLPKMQPFASRTDPYPLEGKQQRLEGRVLASLQIDSKGNATSIEFLRAEAPPPIQAAACHLLQELQFVRPGPGADASDPRPFLVTVRFCIISCARVAKYPDGDDISIAGSPLPKDRRFVPLPSKPVP